jgi:peptidoglycan-associated lipoprotein
MAAGKTGSPTKSSVYFEYDRDDIRPQFRGVIEEHAKYLRDNPALRVRVEGNADERGSREYNVALGQRRAEAVVRALGLLGVPASRMEALSYGEEKPRRTGHDEASWAENRRDDVVLEAGRQ